MKLSIVAGTPGAGKTAVMLHCLRMLLKEGISTAVVKIDCLNTEDHLRFGKMGVPVLLGLSKDMCPDHYSIYNTDAMIDFAVQNNRDSVIVETAGLCHRCAPYTTNCLAICVIDATAGPNNPTKVGPFLACADIVAVSKGDMISQAEREIFRERILETNPGCKIIEVNGLSGQGCAEVVKAIKENTKHISEDEQLRHNAPFSVCTLCAGEKRTGSGYHRGLLRNMEGLQKYNGE